MWMRFPVHVQHANYFGLFTALVLDEKFFSALRAGPPRDENLVQRRIDLEISFAVRARHLMNWHSEVVMLCFLVSV